MLGFLLYALTFDDKRTSIVPPGPGAIRIFPDGKVHETPQTGVPDDITEFLLFERCPGLRKACPRVYRLARYLRIWFIIQVGGDVEAIFGVVIVEAGWAGGFSANKVRLGGAIG